MVVLSNSSRNHYCSLMCCRLQLAGVALGVMLGIVVLVVLGWWVVVARDVSTS